MTAESPNRVLFLSVCVPVCMTAAVFCVLTWYILLKSEKSGGRFRRTFRFFPAQETSFMYESHVVPNCLLLALIFCMI